MSDAPEPQAPTSSLLPADRERDLFLVSALVLFLELACIRWFPAHVLFLTFFTNTVLLACFLGMSVGCLIAGRRTWWLPATPALLALTMGAAHWVEQLRRSSGSVIEVGNTLSPQLVFFGTEYQAKDPAGFAIPIEVVAAFFFLAIALLMIGPGQQLGRCLNGVTDRVRAYTLNISGSIAGILAFTLCSWWELSPLWWFGAVLAGLVYFLSPGHPWRHAQVAVCAALACVFISQTAGSSLLDEGGANRHLWSPYYRVDYADGPKVITVNLIGHQQMVSRETVFPAYSLPHLLNRDAGGHAFGEVLIIGAGSGNDVSRAIQWRASRIDAVEIDPAIYRLGRQHHPDAPYDDRVVHVHLDDGRNFLRATDRKYDLVVYALVDSLVLHSSYSNIRLESYLFTTEAFRSVKDRLKPGGVFAIYNFFRQGWILNRVHSQLEEVFGQGNPLVLNMPARERITEDQTLYDEFTLFFAGNTAPMRQAFATHGDYWLPNTQPPGPSSPDGFALPTPESRLELAGAKSRAPTNGYLQFSLTNLVPPTTPVRLATDDWPFLYLREPMVPSLSLRGIAVMAALALLLLVPCLRGAGREPRQWPMLARMFLLGAGFMLVETKAVVQMALLFGSTWLVNSIVFFGVLVMILAANLYVLRARPTRLMPYYVGLLASLTVAALVPMDVFLGMGRTFQVLGACIVAFLPIVFAGVIFAVSFSATTQPDMAFGANIAGAMLGGFAEYSSMVIGFRYLALVALAFYALSIATEGRRQAASA